METEKFCDSVRVAGSFVAGVLPTLPALLVSANDCTATSSLAAALTLMEWPAYIESGVTPKVVITGGVLGTTVKASGALSAMRPERVTTRAESDVAPVVAVAATGS